MFTGKNILITGGTGFLGSYLCKRIVDLRASSIVIPTTKIRDKTTIKKMNVGMNTIHLIKGDVTDIYFLRELFNEYEFDIVFHLAAISEIRKCQTDSKLAFDVNIMGTINILEICRKYSKIEAIVVSSSDKAYGSNKVLPYKEDYPLNGNSIYEVSKSCVDLIARSYFNNFNVPVAVTRCSNLYGPLDKNESRIIPNTIKKIMTGESPIIWKGSEKSIREFLYIEDAVDAYVSIVENIEKAKGNAYNIGSGEIISIKELVELIISKIDKSISINYVEKGFPEISYQYLDSRKIMKELGWKANILLNDGIDKIIKFHNNK